MSSTYVWGKNPPTGKVTMLLALVLASLIGTAPLFIAVAVAVLSGDSGRRADAREVVSLLRRGHLLPASRRRRKSGSGDT